MCSLSGSNNQKRGYFLLLFYCIDYNPAVSNEASVVNQTICWKLYEILYCKPQQTYRRYSKFQLHYEFYGLILPHCKNIFLQFPLVMDFLWDSTLLFLSQIQLYNNVLEDIMTIDVLLKNQYVEIFRQTIWKRLSSYESFVLKNHWGILYWICSPR